MEWPRPEGQRRSIGVRPSTAWKVRIRCAFSGQGSIADTKTAPTQKHCRHEKVADKKTSHKVESRPHSGTPGRLLETSGPIDCQLLLCEGLPAAPRSNECNFRTSPGCKLSRFDSHPSCGNPNQPLRLLLLNAILVPSGALVGQSTSPSILHDFAVRARLPRSEDWSDTTADPESEKRPLANRNQPPNSNVVSGQFCQSDSPR